MSTATQIAARTYGLSVEVYKEEVDPGIFLLLDALEPSDPGLRRQTTEVAYGALGTVSDRAFVATRSYVVLEWLIRVYVPWWLAEAGLPSEAETVRGLEVAWSTVTQTTAALKALRGVVVEAREGAATAAWPASLSYAASRRERRWDEVADLVGHGVWTAARDAVAGLTADLTVLRSYVWDVCIAAAMTVVFRAIMRIQGERIEVAWSPVAPWAEVEGVLKTLLRETQRGLEPALLALIQDLIARVPEVP